MQPDLYSKWIQRLKVLLPIAALALLSTLFLLSRQIDPEAAIPFADTEIIDRLRDQQVTGPFFSGTTKDGDQISFSAEKLTTPDGQLNTNRAEKVLAKMQMTAGTEFRLSANSATFDLARDLAEIDGRASLTSSTGYTISSEKLTAKMSALFVQSQGPVVAKGPFGELRAGGMTLEKPDNHKAAQLIFNDGVKLIYNPKKAQE